MTQEEKKIEITPDEVPEVMVPCDLLAATVSALELAHANGAYTDPKVSEMAGHIFQALLSLIPVEYLQQRAEVINAEKEEEESKIIKPYGDKRIIVPE